MSVLFHLFKCVSSVYNSSSCSYTNRASVYVERVHRRMKEGAEELNFLFLKHVPMEELRSAMPWVCLVAPVKLMR